MLHTSAIEFSCGEIYNYEARARILQAVVSRYIYLCTRTYTGGGKIMREISEWLAKKTTRLKMARAKFYVRKSSSKPPGLSLFPFCFNVQTLLFAIPKTRRLSHTFYQHIAFQDKATFAPAIQPPKTPRLCDANTLNNLRASIPIAIKLRHSHSLCRV